MTVQIKPAPIRRAVTVKASQERAFRIFTSDIGRWWPSTHHIGAAPYKANVLEPRQGGRWYEIGEDGSEADWGHVLAWEPPSRLLLAWQLDAQHRFDPTLVTEVEVLFTPQDDGRTRVELEHRLLERYGEDAQKVADSVGSPNGWGRVLELFADAANA
ncbi:SRPBCC family protein [Phenylobacterium sp. Root700]|uniref:SRPBCC family protein n=1 Tax=Phenylobacterium sp. Root700 TaxID=1736591 RepID=UPI0006F8B194|nr:SRPBCC family protein [Phenylobacterium sp. Root700]KRB52520.1 ATPase [Phenylobacterium sp. Root700]